MNPRSAIYTVTFAATLRWKALKPNPFSLFHIRTVQNAAEIARHKELSKHLPDTVDWRDKGAITRVKDQGLTTACFAFATVASVEAAYQIANKELLELSEQVIMDCATQMFKKTREEYGLFTTNAFRYIVKNGGLPLESHYPFKGFYGKCSKEKKQLKAVSIEGFLKVPKNEYALKIAVANQPVTVSLATNHHSFEYYKGEYVFREYCGMKLDHAATIVGYGTTSDLDDYWLIKNSWGPEWGDKGYMRLARNVQDNEGQCRILARAYYPLMKGLKPPQF